LNALNSLGEIDEQSILEVDEISIDSKDME